MTLEHHHLSKTHEHVPAAGDHAHNYLVSEALQAYRPEQTSITSLAIFDKHRPILAEFGKKHIFENATQVGLSASAHNHNVHHAFLKTHIEMPIRSHVTNFVSNLSTKIARIAGSTADHLGTVGNCAIGPRLTFEKLGLHLPSVVATEQGSIIERSGLFHQVAREQVRPGDYAYRHWSQAVIRKHGGVDKGDAFIVASVGAHGELYGANDHRFVVPEDGDRYRNTKFFRPNSDFLSHVTPA